MNAFGMSMVATCLFSEASVTAISMTDSVCTVGLAVSLLDIQVLCVLPFAQCLAFTVPDFFRTRNVRDSMALFFSKGDMLSTWTGVKHFLSWSCSMSLFSKRLEPSLKAVLLDKLHVLFGFLHPFLWSISGEELESLAGGGDPFI